MKRKLWTLLLALGAALALCVGASAADFLTGWDEVTNSTTTLESGKQYYLNNDVTVSQTITVRGTVTLDRSCAQIRERKQGQRDCGRERRAADYRGQQYE